MKSDRKRSIVKSPLRLQPRRVLRSAATTPIRNPSGSAFPFGEMRIPNRAGSEYSTMSCEFNALEKIVHDELGRTCSNGALLLGSASLFERGRLYDEYCAKRNEKLKRKLRGNVAAAKGEDEPRSAYTFETTTKKKKMKESTTVKRSAAVGLADRSEHPRYALRSIKKPPLPVPMSMHMAMAVKMESSVGFNGGGSGRKTRTRRN